MIDRLQTGLDAFAALLAPVSDKGGDKDWDVGFGAFLAALLAAPVTDRPASDADIPVAAPGSSSAAGGTDGSPQTFPFIAAFPSVVPAYGSDGPDVRILPERFPPGAVTSVNDETSPLMERLPAILKENGSRGSVEIELRIPPDLPPETPVPANEPDKPSGTVLVATAESASSAPSADGALTQSKRVSDAHVKGAKRPERQIDEARKSLTISLADAESSDGVPPNAPNTGSFGSEVEGISGRYRTHGIYFLRNASASGQGTGGEAAPVENARTDRGKNTAGNGLSGEPFSRVTAGPAIPAEPAEAASSGTVEQGTGIPRDTPRESLTFAREMRSISGSMEGLISPGQADRKVSSAADGESQSSASKGSAESLSSTETAGIARSGGTQPDVRREPVRVEAPSSRGADVPFRTDPGESAPALRLTDPDMSGRHGDEGRSRRDVQKDSRIRQQAVVSRPDTAPAPANTVRAAVPRLDAAPVNELPFRAGGSDRSAALADGSGDAGSELAEMLAGSRTQSEKSSSVSEPVRAFGHTLSGYRSHDSREIETGVINTIVRQAKFLLQNRRSSATVVLNPPNLGRLKLEIMTENSKITGKILVESREVQELIRMNISDLRQSLAQNGLAIESFDVQIGNNGGTGSWARREDMEGIAALASPSPEEKKGIPDSAEMSRKSVMLSPGYIDIWI